MTRTSNQRTNLEVSTYQKQKDILIAVVFQLWILNIATLLSDYTDDLPPQYLNATLQIFGDCSSDLHCYPVPTKTLLFCLSTILTLYGFYQHHNPKTDVPQSTLFSQQSKGEAVKAIVVKDEAEQPPLHDSSPDFNLGQQ